MADAIRINGLSEFVRGIKQLDADAPKVLRVAFNNAGEAILAAAQAKVPTKSGRARRSVRARSTQTAFRIVGGGARVPYYPWLDFGGQLPRGGKRPFMHEGRYIYAAYYKHRDDLAVKLEAALIDAARSAGIEVD